jgi:hypothetical protein
VTARAGLRARERHVHDGRLTEGRKVAVGLLQGRITHEEFLDRAVQIAAQERADAIRPPLTTMTAGASGRGQEGQQP